MSNTDGEDTQKVSLGELLLNAGTRIVDLEKQSNDQVEIITHLEKQLASLREQLANSRDEVHELNVQTDNLNNELLMTKEQLASEEEQSKKYLSLSLDYRNQIQQKEDENRELVDEVEYLINQQYIRQGFPATTAKLKAIIDKHKNNLSA